MFSILETALILLSKLFVKSTYLFLQSASVMMDSLLHEEKHSVRQMALSVYVKHPLRNNVSKEEENNLLR